MENNESIKRPPLLSPEQLKKPHPTIYQPTPVLFIRGLTTSVSQTALWSLCSQSGPVTDLLVLPTKGQAFVQFNTLQSAQLCLQHFSLEPPILNGTRLFFSHSNRQKITKVSQQPSYTPFLILTISNQRFPVTVEVLSQILKPFGSILSSQIFPQQDLSQCLVQLDSPESALAAQKALNGRDIYTGCNRIKAEFFKNPIFKPEESSKVVFLQNLSQGLTPDMLFNLFSLYGNVMRVKIFFQRKDLGLLQFENSQQASVAQRNLHNLRLRGKTIFVSISRSNYINMPPLGRKDDFCRDYSSSSFHRLKKAGSKNCMNIFPPSAVLHLANLADCIDQEYAKGLLEGVEEFRVIGEQMALVKFNDVETAVEALIKHHNKDIEGRHLKISFSKAIFQAIKRELVMDFCVKNLQYFKGVLIELEKIQ